MRLAVSKVLSHYPGTRIERPWFRSEEELDQERKRIESESGKVLSDPNLWYRLFVPPTTDAQALVKELKSVPIVETVYVEPPPAPPPKL